MNKCTACNFGIKEALGEEILDKVESIRKLSKSSRAGNEVQRTFFRFLSTTKSFLLKREEYVKIYVAVNLDDFF